MGQDPAYAALKLGLGRYRAGKALADDDRLGSLYRIVSDLCMTHFGVTLLQVGAESDLEKLSLEFGASAFHLGWAELVLGWLLVLADRQLATAIAAEPVFAISDALRDETAKLAAAIDAALSDVGRCRVEELDDGRYLIHNFRRRPESAPKRFLL